MRSHEAYHAVIGLPSLNSNSETHMAAICDARMIYGRGWISRVFIYGGTLTLAPGVTCLLDPQPFIL